MNQTPEGGRRFKPWALAIAALLALVVAGALDYGLYQMQLQSQSTFKFRPQLWASVASSFLLAAMLIGMAWLAHRAPARSPFTGALLLLVGAISALYPVLTIELGFGSWLPLAARLSLGRHFLSTGAYLALLGLLLLLRSIGHSNDVDKQ